MLSWIEMNWRTQHTWATTMALNANPAANKDVLSASTPSPGIARTIQKDWPEFRKAIYFKIELFQLNV